MAASRTAPPPPAPKLRWVQRGLCFIPMDRSTRSPAQHHPALCVPRSKGHPGNWSRTRARTPPRTPAKASRPCEPSARRGAGRREGKELLWGCLQITLFNRNALYNPPVTSEIKAEGRHRCLKTQQEEVEFSGKATEG